MPIHQSSPSSCRSELAFVFLLCSFVRAQSGGSRVLAEHHGRFRSQQLSVNYPPYSRRVEKPIFMVVAACNTLCSNFCIYLGKRSLLFIQIKIQMRVVHCIWLLCLLSFLTSKLHTPPTFVSFFMLKLDHLSCRISHILDLTDSVFRMLLNLSLYLLCYL